MSRVLASNSELTNRLIDVALNADNDLFDEAFGEANATPQPPKSAAAGPPMAGFDRAEAQRRQLELTAEVCDPQVM